MKEALTLSIETQVAAAAAVAALFAVAATSLGREGEALLLQWGAPRDGKAFIWGPPTMRPDRQALSLGKGTRGRTPRIAPQAGAGQRMPPRAAA